jgi:hypothetical protein
MPTGVWAGAAPGAPVLRPLRGSHLVFAARARAAAPRPRLAASARSRPVFAHVWEGAVVVGTTDVDHPDRGCAGDDLAEEADYLVEALRLPFPRLRLARCGGAVGVRRAARDRRAARRGAPAAFGDGARLGLWTRPGLIGITGGKLTTHRATAAEVLREVEAQGVALAAGAAASPGRRAATGWQGRLGSAGAAWVAARPERGAATARGDALCPGRAALVDARGAGAPSRRPAAAPHPARSRGARRRRGRAGDARSALPRGTRLGRGALGRGSRRAIGRTGRPGMRRRRHTIGRS